MSDPYRDLPDDFTVPLYPQGVNLPDEMRAFWLGRIESHGETIEQLERLVTLARMTRNRAVLNARIASNITAEEIADLLGLTIQGVHKIEQVAREQASKGSSD